MEPWDILDADGNSTGRIAFRGQPLGKGEYHLVVHVYITNGKGEFLIQKRSMKKELWPGAWDVAGGAVLAGESSRHGAVREIQEELGIALEPGELSFVARLRRRNNFVDIWLTQADSGLHQMTMQADEVDELRFVSAEDLMGAISLGDPRDDEYRNLLEDAIRAQR